MSDAPEEEVDAAALNASDPLVIEPEDAKPAVPEPRVEIRRNDEGRRYEISLDSQIAGYSEFRLEPGHIVFTHTVTLPSYTGRGVATTLVEGMLADARARGERVIPKCPFVREYLTTHHQFDDIIDDA